MGEPGYWVKGSNPTLSEYLGRLAGCGYQSPGVVCHAWLCSVMIALRVCMHNSGFHGRASHPARTVVYNMGSHSSLRATQAADSLSGNCGRSPWHMHPIKPARGLFVSSVYIRALPLSARWRPLLIDCGAQFRFLGIHLGNVWPNKEAHIYYMQIVYVQLQIAISGLSQYLSLFLRWP